jgi:GNAT superfamily N-acetyltransferase
MIQFKRATREDAETLARASQRAFHSDIHCGASGEGGPPGYDSAEWQVFAMKQMIYYKILDNDIIIGGFMVSNRGNGRYELERIFIDPDCQNQGIGAQTFEFIWHEFPLAKRWTLGTPAWNRRTRHFYRKMGFVEVGKDGPDGIRFEKKRPESSVRMNLKNLTEEDIEQFAPPKIFARGVDYSRSGRVIKLEYAPDGNNITAEVVGNYDSYGVEISANERGVGAYCNCPYEGYPCKHIVAVLLSSVNEGK